MGERADNRLLQLAHVGQLLSLPVRFSGVSCDAVDLRARNTPAPAVASRVVGLHPGMSGLDRVRYQYRLLPHIIARVLTIGLDRPAISSGLIPSQRGNGRATAGTKFKGHGIHLRAADAHALAVVGCSRHPEHAYGPSTSCSTGAGAASHRRRRRHQGDP